MQWRGVIKSELKKHTKTIHEQSYKYEDCKEYPKSIRVQITFYIPEQVKFYQRWIECPEIKYLIP